MIMARSKARAWREEQHSKPGDPPFVQTGTLRRSITFVVFEDLKRSRYVLRVGSSLKPLENQKHSYAWLLEMGSPGGQLAARPYLRPAVLNHKAEVSALLGEKWTS